MSLFIFPRLPLKQGIKAGPVYIFWLQFPSGHCLAKLDIWTCWWNATECNLMKSHLILKFCELKKTLIWHKIFDFSVFSFQTQLICILPRFIQPNLFPQTFKEVSYSIYIQCKSLNWINLGSISFLKFSHSQRNLSTIDLEFLLTFLSLIIIPIHHIYGWEKNQSSFNTLMGYQIALWKGINHKW